MKGRKHLLKNKRQNPRPQKNWWSRVFWFGLKGSFSRRSSQRTSLATSDAGQVTEAGLPVFSRVCTGNTNSGNDAAASGKPLDPLLQWGIERWPTPRKAIQQ
jgi:hypothetical protein